MNIAIESQVLNHHQHSGLMTYAQGLVHGMSQLDKEEQYSLLYYSLTRKPVHMPGPRQANFRKIVLPVPDFSFFARQNIIDQAVLPLFFKINETRIFHRLNGYTMPRSKNIFRILTVHDLRTLTIKDNVWKQDMGSYQRSIKDIDVCVVVSECTKKDLIKYLNFPEKKVKVIYLGADSRFRPAGPQDIQFTLNKYKLERPFLFSVGSVPRKNIEGIIRGFAHSHITKDYQLVLGCHADIKKYYALAESLNIKDRVMILPDLNDQDLINLYSSCHIFVFPSLYEGFGLPILEAFQCKAPVITSNVSSCPEVAGDAAILVDPDNIGQIASAIDQVCSDDILRQQLIEKGEQRAKLFGWDKFAQEMKKIYTLA